MRLARRWPWLAGRGEVGMAVREEHNGFAIDQGIVDGQGAHRLRDPWKPVPEQSAAATPHLDAFALLSGEDPESVMLDLMQPDWPGGRIGDESWLTGLDETGRQVAPKTRRRGTPQHAPVYRGQQRRRQRAEAPHGLAGGWPRT